jgi:hypothetical protein
LGSLNSAPSLEGAAAANSLNTAIDDEGLAVSDPAAVWHLEAMSGGAPEFVRHWLETAPSLQRVFCRVEGTDDVLLIEAMLSIVGGFQKKSVVWTDFTFGLAAHDRELPQLRLCCSVLSPQQLAMQCGGVLELAFENPIPDLQRSFSIVYRDKTFIWTDLVDNDLMPAFTLDDLRVELSCEPYADCHRVMFHRWKWGRGIENLLLPVQTPLVVFRKNPDKAGEFTREVFETISKNFFPTHPKFRFFTEWSRSPDFSQVGCGWAANDFTIKEFKDEHHHDRLRLLGHKLFSRRVISTVFDLMHQNPQTLAVHAYIFLCFYEMLQLISKEHSAQESTDKSEKRKFEQQKNQHIKGIFSCFADVIRTLQIPLGSGPLPESISLYGDLRAHLEENGKESWKCMDEVKRSDPARLSKFYTRHKGLPFWFHFARFCSFLAHLCILQDSAYGSLKNAAHELLLLIQRAIFVVMFDLPVDDATPAPHSLLFQLNDSASCSGFLPITERHYRSRRQGNSALDEHTDFDDVMCASCGRDARDHILRTQFDAQSSSESFLAQFARIASIGWSPHYYAEIAIGRLQIGFPFQVGNVKIDGSGDSQVEYRTRLDALMADFELRDVEQCFSEDQRQHLDDVSMQRVTDSMKRLHLLRREEIHAVAYWIKMRLCSGAAAP